MKFHSVQCLQESCIHVHKKPFAYPFSNMMNGNIWCNTRKVGKNVVWLRITYNLSNKQTYENTLLEAVHHFHSVVMDAGSCKKHWHAHECCIFQSYAKTVPSWMKLTMREPANHDNGQGVTASDVILQTAYNEWHKMRSSSSCSGNAVVR